MTQASVKDFFISYNRHDRAWAEWIAWQLENEGYTTVVQAWDFHAGDNFVLDMDRAARVAQRTIAVLSPDYLTSHFTQPEWAAAFVQDPNGQHGTVLPVRVKECDLTGLLAAIAYIDLVSKDESAAREALLAGVHRTRTKPSKASAFPGSVDPQPSSFPGEWPVAWNVPYQRNQFFTGREDLLQHLHDSLTGNQATALTQTHAISGLGGVGKTQTAIEYAYRYQKDYQFVLWVNAATHETLLTDVVKIADLLQVPGRDTQDQQRTVAAVKSWLGQQKDWLLILDNADEIAVIQDFLPTSARVRGHILITTRVQAAGGLARAIDVEKMERTDGILLLLRRARLLNPLETLDQLTAQQRAEAEDIVTALDGLPLAIDQAGAYIEETACSLARYLAFYQSRRRELLARRGRRATEHPDSVAATWSLAFQNIEQEDPAAAELLRLCAFLAPDAIPEELFTGGAEHLGDVLGPVAADEFTLNETIGVLWRYSLIKRNADMNTLSIHRLVQTVLRDNMTEEKQRLWVERLVYALDSIFPSMDYADRKIWVRRQRYLAQVQACVEWIDRYRLALPEAADVLSNAGYSLYLYARYQEAEPLLQRAVGMRENVSGKEHSSTADVQGRLASLYQAQGKYEQAEPLFQQALATSEKVLGVEHPDTARTQHQLASLYQDQGKYEQAEPLFQQALATREKALGLEHPDTVITVDSYASLLRTMKRAKEAAVLEARFKKERNESSS
jgi:tetratricopeptide (TPR) repeat protein